MPDIQIINNALQLVNQPAIQTLADLSNASKIILSIYDEAYAYLLSIENFSFSVNTSTLATVTNPLLTPGYTVAKAFPSGALSIVRVWDDHHSIPHYKIVGKQLHFLRDSQFVCEYTSMVPETDAPPHFRTAFAHYLAYRIAGNLHESQSMIESLKVQYQDEMRRSVEVDAVNARAYVPQINNNTYSEPYDSGYLFGQETDRWGYPING
jgi:hypothetical protein